jgi:predicted nucleic acid-binding protein
VKVLFDTSVLIASVLESHPHHRRALPVVLRAANGNDEGHVAAHGLAETYAVLTTLPVSPRIGPDAAHRLVAENIIAHFDVVALTAREYQRLIAQLPESAIIGGATYDAIHVVCARKVGVDRLYTFNTAHFRRIAPDLAESIAAP